MVTIKISKSELLKKLSVVSKIISSKQVNPIMDYVFFETKSGKLYLSAADISGRIDTSIENVTYDFEFKICFDARLLIEALKTLPEQPIEFSINEENFATVIKYAGGKFELVGKETSTFPAEAEIKEPINIAIPAETLINGISKTIDFTADNDLRPVMMGVYVESTGESLNFVTTDGHAMAICENELSLERLSFILPNKISHIIKTIIPAKGDIQIEAGTNKAKITAEDISITVVLIEGKFPNYKSVIPQNNHREAKINTQLLKGALSRTMIFSGSTRLIRFGVDDNLLQLTAQDIDFSNSAEEKVECETVDAPIMIGFNGGVLQNVVSLIESEDVVVKLSEPSRAGLFYPSENESFKLTYLIMPVMIND